MTITGQVVIAGGNCSAARLAVDCTSYVRSILPPETEPLWARLGQALETRQTTGSSLWSALDEKIEERTGARDRL